MIHISIIDLPNYLNGDYVVILDNDCWYLQKKIDYHIGRDVNLCGPGTPEDLLCFLLGQKNITVDSV